MNPMLYLLAGLALGAVLGGLIGWLFGSRRSPAAPLAQKFHS